MIEKLDYIPNVLRSEEINGIKVEPKTLNLVKNLMTPEEVLNQTSFDLPEAISPLKYPTFADLVKERLRIRDLKLVPIKTDEERARYKSEPKELLYSRILDYLGNSSMALAINAYPYFLPDDLAQFLVWIKNRDAKREEVENFIGKCIKVLSIKKDEIILFERSLGFDTKLIRGSYKDIRHIHIWIKI